MIPAVGLQNWRVAFPADWKKQFTDRFTAHAAGSPNAHAEPAPTLAQAKVATSQVAAATPSPPGFGLLVVHSGDSEITVPAVEPITMPLWTHSTPALVSSARMTPPTPGAVSVMNRK